MFYASKYLDSYRYTCTLSSFTYWVVIKIKHNGNNFITKNDQRGKFHTYTS